MQDFYEHIAQRGPTGPYGVVTPERYQNHTHKAYDWPTEIEVDGQIYTCTLTDNEQQKWDKYGMRPWNGHGPQIAIRDRNGKMVTVYRSVTTAPSWSLREEFTEVREYDLGYVRKQNFGDRLDPAIQKGIEDAFLAATKYAPIQTVNVFENGFESIWNVKNAYQAKKAQLESDSVERELYGGKTWQEQYDDL